MSEKTKIEELYESAKSKSFVNHLIQSYLPIHKAEKIWDFEKTQSHKCNVCDQNLFSIGEYMKGVSEKSDEISKDFTKFLKKQLIDNEPVTREEHPIIKHVVGDAVIGWTADKTNTTLCLQCVKDILELTQNGIMKDDKNIIWLTKKMQRTEFFGKIYESDNVSAEEKDKAKQIHKAAERKKVTTFADLGILQELKEKLEKS